MTVSPLRIEDSRRLPSQVGNDKGRYRQKHVMMQIFCSILAHSVVKGNKEKLVWLHREAEEFLDAIYKGGSL